MLKRLNDWLDRLAARRLNGKLIGVTHIQAEHGTWAHLGCVYGETWHIEFAPDARARNQALLNRKCDEIALAMFGN